MTDTAPAPAPGLEAYDRFPLLHGPSPVHRLARLTHQDLKHRLAHFGIPITVVDEAPVA